MEFSFNSFFVGVVVTIVLSIIANLLTPDRRSLINSIRNRVDRFRNWLAKRSANRAKRRIDELKLELDRISNYASSEAELSTFIMGEILYILFDFCTGTGILALALLFSTGLTWLDLRSILRIPSLFFYLRAIWRGGSIKDTLSKVRNCAEYSADVERAIVSLEEVLARYSGESLMIDVAPETRTQQEQRVIFYDTFEEFAGWERYRDGNVSQSGDVSHTGACSLKKDGKNDPNGGFKEIGKNIDLGIVFSGWIYRPAEGGGGRVNRLAIEDQDFNGYGFAVAHDTNQTFIERRENGRSNPLEPRVSFNPPEDQWYQFKLYMKRGGKFDLRILDQSDGELASVLDVSDEKYSLFDRVVVHGGFPYYVDELKVQVS